MAFKTDAHGIAFACRDIKLQANGSSWGMKLSQLARQKGTLRILTYSLPDMAYVQQQLGRRPMDIFIIAHTKFVARALAIAQAFPDIAMAVHPKLHSKILLLAPQTVVISSANFGTSGWEETSVSFHAQAVHDWYIEHVYQRLWTEAQKVQP